MLSTLLIKTTASCFKFPTLKMEVTNSFATFAQCLVKQREFTTEKEVTFLLQT